MNAKYLNAKFLKAQASFTTHGLLRAKVTGDYRRFHYHPYNPLFSDAERRSILGPIFSSRWYWRPRFVRMWLSRKCSENLSVQFVQAELQKAGYSANKMVTGTWSYKNSEIIEVHDCVENKSGQKIIIQEALDWLRGVI